jgi:iron uptake system component EfeO
MLASAVALVTACHGSPATHHGAGRLTVSIGADGCAVSPRSLAAGPTTISVSEPHPSTVTEVEVGTPRRVLAEVEALAAGQHRSISLDLAAGTYTVSCPGSTLVRRQFLVTGTAPHTATPDPLAAKQLREGVTAYAGWVRRQVAALVTSTRRLDAAVRAGHAAAARALYPAARVRYERVEAVAEGFTVGAENLDTRIDGRASDVPAARWRGFHRIERSLFTLRTTAGAPRYATELDTDVGRLQRLVATAHYQPAQLMDGAVSLLEEIEKTKVTGEEERYSHLDLLDLTANLTGVQEAFVDVQAGLQLLDPALVEQLTGRFAGLDDVLVRYRDPGALGGVVPFDRLSGPDRRGLSEATLALLDPLSTVAAVLVTA